MHRLKKLHFYAECMHQDAAGFLLDLNVIKGFLFEMFSVVQDEESPWVVTDAAWNPLVQNLNLSNRQEESDKHS